MSDSEKLDLILTGVFDLNTRMYRVEEEIRLFKDRMDKVEAELKEVKEEIALLKDGMKEVKEEIAILKEDMKEVKEEVSKTSLIIENELRVNIQRIAEGHLDLSRNMNNVIRPNNEMEVLVVRVGVLETEVKYIKKNLHMSVAK